METHQVGIGTDSLWKGLYRVGGAASLAAFAGVLFDIIFGSLTGGNLTALPQTAVERFAEFQGNWFLGLYHLDLLNVLTSLVMLPAGAALVAAHRKVNLPFALLAFIILFLGTAVFVTTNTALAMLDLSGRYYTTSDESYRTLLAAAGEALLVQGEHGSPGVFTGFALSTIGSIALALVMVRGKVFGRGISITGVIGHSLLLVYVVLVTFVPGLKSIAMLLAAPGGLMALAWIGMVAVRLLRLEA